LGVFFGPTPKLFVSKWLPLYCEGEIFGPFSDLKEKQFGYVSN
jgi:hypothetical protein